MKVVGFMHVYAVNNYKEIVDRQVKLIEESELIDVVDRIYYSVIGKSDYRIDRSKYELLFSSDNLKLSECVTINMLREVVMQERCKAFYVHTKGVTKPKSKSARDWRQYMEYFTICHHYDCRRFLEVADAVGVNWHYGSGYLGAAAVAKPHFSGNFWWSKYDYLKTLPELNAETSVYKGIKRYAGIELPTRWDAEFWIGRGNPTVVELWNSGVHHGSRVYPSINYILKSIRPIIINGKETTRLYN